MKRILFSVALLIVTTSVWGQGPTKPIASAKARRKAVEKRLGKQADYYALRYTYSSPTMPGSVGKGAGVATHLKLYDSDGTYIGTISEGYDGKYHSPAWMKLTGTLKKEDTATSHQRYIAGADLPDIVLSTSKQTGVGQVDSVLKTEMQDVLVRVQQAVGKDWTVTVQPAPHPNPGPAGGARGFVIHGISKTMKTAARIPGQKRLDPKKKEPAQFWVSAFGSYSGQYRPKAMHSWQGWSSTRNYHGSAWLQDRRIRESLFSQLRNALDAHWGPTGNGLRMRLVAPNTTSCIVTDILPRQFLIQNCSNDTVALLPDKTVTLTTPRLPKQSCTAKIAPTRFQLQPGQTVSIPVDIRKVKFPVKDSACKAPLYGDQVTIQCKTAMVKKGENWKTIPLSEEPVNLRATISLPERELLILVFCKPSIIIQDEPAKPIGKPKPATKGQSK